MQPVLIRTVCFSPTGTSKKIADAVARAIAGNDTDTGSVDLTCGTSEQTTLPANAVAVIAAPVYGGHIPPAAVERLRALRGQGTPAVVIAVYGNRAFDGAVAELAALATAQGFVPIAAAAFIGEHSYSTSATPIAAGRPDARDLADAEAFGTEVRRKLAAGLLAPVDARKLKTPRTPLLPMLRFVRFFLANRRRQKKTPVVYLPACNADLCIHCGRCAALCPTQAIARGAEEKTDPARCLRCCACVKGCPTAARTFSTPFADALSRSFARRKPPVTLL